MTSTLFDDACTRAAGALKRSGRVTGVEKFYDDPAGFVHEAFHWGPRQSPTPYQDDILNAIPREKRVAARGPHGLGKTAIDAWVILWFATTREARGVDWKIATTAGAWRQLEKYLWPEVHKWAKRLRPEVIGRNRYDTRTELLTLNLKLGSGSAFAVASDDPALIEGVHADEVLYIFDESKAISAAVFDAAEGAFSGSGGEGLNAYALATSTPGVPSGRFYDIHARKPGFDDWWVRHVTLEECIAAGRVSEHWVESRRLQWGGDSGVFANRVLGEFHSDDENGVVPLSWIEAAQNRWTDWSDAGCPELPGPRTVGVDVARSGLDNTVFAIRNGVCITELRKSNGRDTMETSGAVKGILNAEPLMTAIVDVIGVGGGVVDRLREEKQKVEAFNASESTTMLDRSGELGFSNTRSAAIWKMRELLDPAFGSEIMLPNDDMLTGDLTAPTWRVLSGGKIQVESKDDIKKRLGRSTDDGDAVVMAFWDGADHSAEGWAEYLRKQAALNKKPEPDPEAPPLSREEARRANFAAAAQGRL